MGDSHSPGRPGMSTSRQVVRNQTLTRSGGFLALAERGLTACGLSHHAMIPYAIQPADCPRIAPARIGPTRLSYT